jgi:multicomponent Na+:H+ antiporter subunit E
MPQSRAARVFSLGTKAALPAGLWWIVVQGRPEAWLVGLPAVALAAVVGVRLRGPALRRFSLAGLFGFALLFIRESLLGGFDVARRTLGPVVRVSPGFRKYRLNLKDPAARVLFINCVGLLPGTLAADLDGDHAELHLLDVGAAPEPQLLRLEQSVARLYGLQAEIDDD